MGSARGLSLKRDSRHFGKRDDEIGPHLDVFEIGGIGDVDRFNDAVGTLQINGFLLLVDRRCYFRPAVNSEQTGRNAKCCEAYVAR